MNLCSSSLVLYVPTLMDAPHSPTSLKSSSSLIRSVFLLLCHQCLLNCSCGYLRLCHIPRILYSIFHNGNLFALCYISISLLLPGHDKSSPVSLWQHTPHLAVHRRSAPLQLSVSSLTHTSVNWQTKWLAQWIHHTRLPINERASVTDRNGMHLFHLLQQHLATSLVLKLDHLFNILSLDNIVKQNSNLCYQCYHWRQAIFLMVFYFVLFKLIESSKVAFYFHKRSSVDHSITKIILLDSQYVLNRLWNSVTEKSSFDIPLIRPVF